MDRTTRPDELIALLALQPHPEGGHYREVHRSACTVPTPRGPRSAGTAIHFLLVAGQVSRWHRVAADELWNWYEGDALELLLCPAPGRPLQRQVLGPAQADRLPLVVVPANWWQAAVPLGAYALVGCTVHPGFDFADFTLAEADAAAQAWLPRLDRRGS